jgi:glycosyltransferase involved in cell wall biosynthesis
MREREDLNEYKALNLVDSSLSGLKKKGNFEYAEELYNPSNVFSEVHHISLFPEDRGIKFKNESIKLHVLRSIFWKVPLLNYIINAPLFLYQILKICKKHKINIIRGRGPHRGSFLGLIVSRLLHIPFIVSLGGDYRLAQELEKRYYVLNNRLLSFKIEEFVLRGADLVFCPNQFTRHYVIRLGVDPSKIKIIPIRLSRNIFDFSVPSQNILEEAGVDKKKPVVLFVGRFEKDKQVDVLIETIPLILKEKDNVQFVFIGNGSLMAPLKKRTMELQINSSVWFLGYQDTDVIKYCLKISSVVWIPMSGFVVFEAAAAAKPIVSFNVEWHSEFIRNEETGLLIENRNIKECAKAVLKVLNDKKLAQTLGENAKAELHRNYNPYDIAKKEIEVYKIFVEKIPK